MDVRQQTEILLIGTVCILALWDVYAIRVCGVEASITKVVYDASRRWPVIPFALGLVCGHLLWR